MGAENGYLHCSIRGFHVYKAIWSAPIGEVLLCESEIGNAHDPYAVSVISMEIVVGHIPRRISTLSYKGMESVLPDHEQSS